MRKLCNIVTKREIFNRQAGRGGRQAGREPERQGGEAGRQAGRQVCKQGGKESLTSLLLKTLFIFQ